MSSPARPQRLPLRLTLLLGCFTFYSTSLRAANSDSLKVSRAQTPDFTESAKAEFFEKEIRPLLIEHCLKCHDSAKSKAGLRLDSRPFILKGGDSGPAAKPGEPEFSRLIEAVHGTNPELQMPPKDERQLSHEQIQKLELWVRLGLPFPGGAPAPKTLEEARKFWSFQPLNCEASQATKTSPLERSSAEIDRQVRRKLSAQGLPHSPPADKQTLLRRVSYDVTGLPPSPADAEQFLSDNSPDAYARLVDRLLASPQYGVHWARHWLDVARYGDTRWVGAGEDRRFPFAYTYRDWVVGAFNEDMPYDRFVTLQLAADQTPTARQGDLAALGFLTVGRWFAGAIPDVIDDQIDVITRGLLGLTVQCARCHDHKFDPVSAKDYYALYGLLNASRMPVDGSGTLASLPLLETPPVADSLETEHAALRKRFEDFLKEKQDVLHREFGAPEMQSLHLLAATACVGNKDDANRAFARERGLNEYIFLRWVRLLQRTSKAQHPVFGAFQALAALTEEEFPSKAPGVLEAQRAQSKNNKKVLEALEPAPASLAETAARYAGVLHKFDGPEPLSHFEEEALRQVARNNESPFFLPFPEVAQTLGAEDKIHLLDLRRQWLEKLAPLPEAADQYLTYQTEARQSIAEIETFLKTRTAALQSEIQSAEKIAEYLLATREVAVAELQDIALKNVAKTRKLGEKMLRRWVVFLSQKALENDPVFALWKAFAALPEQDFQSAAAGVPAQTSGANALVFKKFQTPPATLKEAAAWYGELLAGALAQDLTPDAAAEDLRRVCAQIGSPMLLKQTEAIEYFGKKDTDELLNKERKLARIYQDTPGAPARAMALRENRPSYAQKIFVRGNPNVLGEDAHGGFLEVLAGTAPSKFQPGRGRAELAQSILGQAQPLAARVLVNRVWQWHFGSGLVATASDFGTRGEMPSHPELLDSLAAQFIASGWSVKQLHRDILLSATYQQSSADSPVCRTTDPDNRLLWRMNRRRLGFEELRDSCLQSAGRLDLQLGGRPSDLSHGISRRRTLYGAVDRVAMPAFFRYFDFPGADAHAPARLETAIPQQALYLMNNSFVLEQAAALAQRSSGALEQSPAHRIQSVFQLALGRRPTPEELSLALAYIASAPPEVLEEPAQPAKPWTYGWGALSPNEGRVVEFVPLAYFTNNQWKGGNTENDPVLGRLSFNARGGTAGRDNTQAAVRRWTAPESGTLAVSGTLSVQANALVPTGEGVRARILSSRHGLLGSWVAHGTESPTMVADIAVERGDTVDFITTTRGREQQTAGYLWAPVLRLKPSASGEATAKEMVWDAAKDFKGETPRPLFMGAWERFCQILLESNEFMFID